MKLTRQLGQELVSIQFKVQVIQVAMNAKCAYENPSDEELQTLAGFKVRVENILLETDVKEALELLAKKLFKI